MNSYHIVKLLESVPVENIIVRDEWVTCSCPFAKYRHLNGTDKNPSFGISIANGHRSNFNCFSCGIKGRLLFFPTLLMQMTGEDRPDLRRIISENDFRLSEPDIVVDVKPGIWTDALYSQSFVPLKGGWRGLSPKFIEYFRIRYDSYSKRIMFPIHDKYGRIVGVKGRTTVDDSIKYKLDTTISSVDPKRLGVWFGMHIPISGSQLFIVESEIDAMLLIQNGVDAWASMSASITNQQIKSLAEVRVPIVLAFDNDYAGMAARSKVLNDLCGIVKIKIVLDYFDCKDVAEIIENRRLSTFLESVNSNKFWC